MSDLSDHDLKILLNNLQQSLIAFPEDMNSLEYELESAARHIPAYIKVIKSHIEQLRHVLSLENHNHRTLETAGLAAPVQQLIKLFNTLTDDDIAMLEELAHAARNWHPELSMEAITASKEQNLYESVEAS